MLFKSEVVSTGGTEVGMGLLVIFDVGPEGEVEFVEDDGTPVGSVVGTLEFEVAGGPAEVTGAVALAMLVVLIDRDVAGVVSVPVIVGGPPVAEVILPDMVLLSSVLDGVVPLTDVALVGTGKVRVVDVNGTTMLVPLEVVALVGRGNVSVVEFTERTMLVDADTEIDVLLMTVSEGGVVETVALTIVGVAVPDGGKIVALPEAVSEGKVVDAVALEVVGTPVPDGNADSELLLVGKGGRALVDSGAGSDVALPVSNGTMSVVELLVMMTLVAAAVPLTIIVVRLPVMAPADRIVIPGVDGEDTLEVGNGATSVVVLKGMMMLVAAAVPLMLSVKKLAVTSLATPVAVLLANVGVAEGGSVDVFSGLTVVTEGNDVLLV